MSPVVSVLMSVHNGDACVAEALESVLNQTFADFEFLVVNDGSTDDTGEVLDGYRDPRLKVVHQPHAGLTRSLNRAIGVTATPLLARMDADDVALPERLTRQVAFLDAHPEVGLLGTGCHEISPSGEVLRTISPRANDRAIRRVLIRENPFVHSSVIFRREVLNATGAYDESLPVAQDYDLWLKMSRVTRMANLPEPLVLRRLTPGRVSSARDTARLRAELLIKVRALRSGAYPLWCALFLAKPLCALAIPPGPRQLLRQIVRPQKSRGTPRANRL